MNEKCLLEIKNECLFSIKLCVYNTYFIIPSDSKMNISVYQNCIVKIQPINVFDDGKSAVDKMIESIAKSSVLITEVETLLKVVSKNASVIIKNDIFQLDEVLGYLYFIFKTYNCGITIKKCKGINEKKVLKFQRICAFGDSMDFPPFSIVQSIIKYRKMKKMCNSQNILQFYNMIKTD